MLSSPEVRMGLPPSSASDVYSLGMLIMQLLTGSEATGLLDYAQKAVERGRLEDILDPCAEGISVPQAIELANIALRSVLLLLPKQSPVSGLTFSIKVLHLIASGMSTARLNLGFLWWCLFGRLCLCRRILGSQHSAMQSRKGNCAACQKH